MNIYCVACGKHVQANLTSGKHLYPHRRDLYDLPFWQCPHCNNFVGCHHKTDDPTKPLGTIVPPEVKKGRMQIHNLLDPLWQDLKLITRGELYSYLSHKLGSEFHVSNVNTVEEVQTILKLVWDLKKALLAHPPLPKPPITPHHKKHLTKQRK